MSDPLLSAVGTAANPASAGADRAAGTAAASNRDRPAAKAPTSELLAVAQEFESLLLAMLLKSMRATVPKNDLMGNSNEVRTYQELQDQQIALEMARGGGLGLAPLIARQLGEQSDAPGAARAALETAHEAGRRALVEQALYSSPGGAGGMLAPLPSPLPGLPQEEP